MWNRNDLPMIVWLSRPCAGGAPVGCQQVAARQVPCSASQPILLCLRMIPEPADGEDDTCWVEPATIAGMVDEMQ